MKRKIRKQICNLISENSRILDIGCGKGELLKELSGKINYGLGIDINKRKINFAKKSKLENIEYKLFNSKNLRFLNKQFDCSILVFALHSMDYETQIRTLENMKKISKRQIIVDFDLGKNIFYGLFVYFDEILARHYKNFSNYKKIGMKKLLLKAGLDMEKKIQENFYSIWILGQ